ncbi:hypothetical protein KSP40_PGU006825 [Platanthera guangdongensis]|uniref:Uncharacterized protein n=1 Tax=Platanthera guangdongensis TaxID=2320717 RepID=A0ABR2LCH2_9ASPA
MLGQLQTPTPAAPPPRTSDMHRHLRVNLLCMQLQLNNNHHLELLQLHSPGHHFNSSGQQLPSADNLHTARAPPPPSSASSTSSIQPACRVSNPHKQRHPADEAPS